MYNSNLPGSIQTKQIVGNQKGVTGGIRIGIRIKSSFYTAIQYVIIK
jgi:hypothetical protein